MKPSDRVALISIPLRIASRSAPANEIPGADEIELPVSDKSTARLKEQDKCTCNTHFAPEGVIKRRVHDTDAHREGRWLLDDSDRPCILWTDKIKPLCFIVMRNADDTETTTKNGKRESSMLELFDGSTEGIRRLAAKAF